MAERKVLIKYFPKNFNHQLITKRGRGRDKLMMVRNMLPMSLRCNTCQNYLYVGTKFNMRMQICNEETYLGIKVFRFYVKCTYCYNEITFKTDPKNHDYLVQAGGTRNYEAIKDAQQAQKVLKRIKVNEKQEDSMKYLQNKSYDSKRQMQLMQALEDIKNLNKRRGIIDPEDLLQNLIFQEQQQQENILNEQDQKKLEQYDELKKKIKLNQNEIETKIKQEENKTNDQIKDIQNIKIQEKKQEKQKTITKFIKGNSAIANMKKKIIKPNQQAK